MNDIPSDSTTEQQDGFDLIDYPCDYAFKAMCRADEAMSAQDYIRELLMPALENGDALLDVTSRFSRTGKFESVTATIRLHSRQELEFIYSLIAHSPRVVMTL